MSEKDYSLVTSKAGTVVAENLKVTLATAGGPAGLSPATITAMVGISQNLSLKIADDVTSVTNYLQSIASSNVAANVTANTILSSMTSLQSSLGFGGSPNQSGFGSIISQCVQHCKDSVQLKQATNFLESVDYDKFGSGIKDMGSMVERGMSNVVGDLNSAAAAMTSTGKMFNGIDVKDFGSSLGVVKALQNNKLLNATGVNRRLSMAGVPLSDLDNPIYQDKINQVLGTVTDPGTLSVVADQFEVAPELAATDTTTNSTANTIRDRLQAIIETLNRFADTVRGQWIPALNDITSASELTAFSSRNSTSQEYKDYNAAIADANRIAANEIRPLPNDEFKLALVNYRNNDVEAAIADANAAISDYRGKGKAIRAMFNAQEGRPTDVTNYETATSGPFAGLSSYTGADASVNTAASSLLGGGSAIGAPAVSSGPGNLSDLGNPQKLAEPGSISGFPGSDALAQKFKDLGASTIANSQVAGSFFGAIQQAATPLTTAAHSTLKSLMDDLKPTIDNMTGSGTGLLGTPNVSDFTQHVSGGPAITGFIQAVQAQGGNALAVNAASLTSLQDSITTAQSLFSKAGVDFGSVPGNSLSTAMTFATNLKKFGQDTLTDVAPVLRNMADTSTKWGESVKASLAEGANDKLFALNGMPPLNSNPFQGLPSDPTANPAGDAGKLMGG